jgi:hypothetical protein
VTPGIRDASQPKLAAGKNFSSIKPCGGILGVVGRCSPLLDISDLLLPAQDKIFQVGLLAGTVLTSVGFFLFVLDFLAVLVGYRFRAGRPVYAGDLGDLGAGAGVACASCGLGLGHPAVSRILLVVHESCS